MLVIENGTLYTPMRVISDGAVLVEGQRIEAIGKREELIIPSDAQHLDAEGGHIAPGFVNMHIHGVGGYSTMDGQVASLQAMSRLLVLHSVTSWLPTTGSAPFFDIAVAYSAIRKAMEDEGAGAVILGGHVEGPYLSPQERGAHPLELLTEPHPDEYAKLL